MFSKYMGEPPLLRTLFQEKRLPWMILCKIVHSKHGANLHSLGSGRQWSPHAQVVYVAIFTGLSHLSCLRILGILGWTCGGNTADPRRNCVICIPIHKVLISKICLIRPWDGRRVSQLPKLGFCLVVKKVCVTCIFCVRRLQYHSFA